MFLDKLKTAALLAAVALGLAACAALAAQPGANPSDPPKYAPVLFIAKGTEQIPAKADPKPLPQGPNKILFYRSGHLTLIDPDGKNEKKVSKDRGLFHPGDAKLSPDGKKLAVLHRIEIPNDPLPGERPMFFLHVRGLDEKEPGTNLGVQCQMFFWSPDGTEIVCTNSADEKPRKMSATHGIVNVKSKKKTALKLPDNSVITDWSRDGKFFLTTSFDRDSFDRVNTTPMKTQPRIRMHLMNRDGTEHKALTAADRCCGGGRLSPDGKRVLYQETEEIKFEDSRDDRLKMLDIASGKSAPVEDIPLNGMISGYCWSPDGKRIAYTWIEVNQKREDVPDMEVESHLVVCDPDGKNPKTIATEKAKGQWQMTIAHVDWR